MEQRERELAAVRPSERQLRYQQIEFYGFFHYTVNTYTNKEWGDGTESPEIFNPTDLDVRQWVRAIKRAGMKGAILTCKHHDGFCLWPSKYTAHSVASSPCKKDIVKEVSDALREEGLLFGVYLSPWDRNHPDYGSGKAYDDYYVNQLTELLTQYGPVFSVWLDGACGEGPNGKKQVYDFERYYETVRKYQPDACICICGPDIRWVGNEAGQGRPSEWSVVSGTLKRAEGVQAISQQADDPAFRERKFTSTELDLGSREALKDARELVWYPAEVDTSIRPGWFYHEAEDDKVRSLEEMKKVYYGSVGGNAMLLLNIPPTPNGKLHPADVKRLEEIGDFIRDAFAENIVTSASVSTPDAEEGHGAEGILEDSYDSYYKLPDGVKNADIVIDFAQEESFRHIVLKENICLGQRVERFQILNQKDGQEEIIHEGTVIGYKKIIPFEKGMSADKLIIRFLEARVCPTLSFVGVYR